MVHVPKSYTGEKAVPLVVSFHGSGQSPKSETRIWKKYAEKGGYILVCPPASKNGASHVVPRLENVKGRKLSSKKEYEDLTVKEVREAVGKTSKAFEELPVRVVQSFNIDRKRVLATGYSGGGKETWELGWGHPEFFTCVCLRSANMPNCIFGETVREIYFQPALVERWNSQPVFIFWGEKDHPCILKKGGNVEYRYMKKPTGEGPFALRCLKNFARLEHLAHEILPGASHGKATAPDVAHKWFVETAIPSIVSLSDGVNVKHCRRDLKKLEEEIAEGGRIKSAVSKLERFAEKDDEKGKEAKGILANARKLFDEKINKLSSLAKESPAKAYLKADELKKMFSGLPEEDKVKKIEDELEEKGGRHLKRLSKMIEDLHEIKEDMGKPSRTKRAQHSAKRLERKLESFIKARKLPESIKKEAESALKKCKTLVA